ncbi:prostate stem cell antigen [Choloepus didactylus]|uniref:prostate stem cell antigen n=1 Tax=Choloepus didactylus TaxID=27675 RepID=UPI0018A0017C|nr:prostate stem cell antigen [Choloepus didactylus]
MKATILALLATGLALQPGTVLQCYSCKTWVDGKDCQLVQNCTQAETHSPCLPCASPLDTLHLPAVGVTGLLKVTSKGCSSQCQEGWQDHYVAKKNVTCCSADLCNASGPSALQPPVGPLGLLALLGGLLLCGPGQL